MSSSGYGWLEITTLKGLVTTPLTPAAFTAFKETPGAMAGGRNMLDD
jgi:hypothetical protein